MALRRMDDLEAELGPVHAQITAFARRQAGCKALARELFGVGPLVAAVVVWAFLVTPAGSPPRPRPCGTPAWT